MPFAMGDEDKPFICTNEGCNMTFSNEDHLNVHHKKHDMVLNLGLAKTPTIADQTPTPTRFIRNCEEVGLFQDLQNVNPFEETFRKAIENSKNGTVHIPEQISEDSLHTPQIFHTEKKTSPQKYEHDDLPEDFSLHSVIPIHDVAKADNEVDDMYEAEEEAAKISFRSVMFESEKEIDLCSSNSSDTVIVENALNSCEDIYRSSLNELTNKNVDFKAELREKLKEALHKRKVEEDPLEISEAERLCMNMRRPRLELVSKVPYPNIQSKKPKGRIREINIYDKNVSEVDKRRLMNRMAQMRSRERKKLWLDQMKEETVKLRTDNRDLIEENKKLKEENAYLKSVLLKHSNCSLNIDIQKELAPQPTSLPNKNLKPIKPRPAILASLPSKVSYPAQVVTKIQIPPLQQKPEKGNSKTSQSSPTTKELPILLPKPVLVTPTPVVRGTPVIKHTSVVPQSTVLTPITTAIVTSQSPVLAKTLSSINFSSDSSMFIQVKMPQAVMLEITPRKGKS